MGEGAGGGEGAWKLERMREPEERLRKKEVLSSE